MYFDWWSMRCITIWCPTTTFKTIELQTWLATFCTFLHSHIVKIATFNSSKIVYSLRGSQQYKAANKYYFEVTLIAFTSPALVLFVEYIWICFCVCPFDWLGENRERHPAEKWPHHQQQICSVDAGHTLIMLFMDSEQFHHHYGENDLCGVFRIV